MMTNTGRPAWDEFFLSILDALGARATCDRGRTACVITIDNRIISTGYVGSPPGLPHCDDVGHLIIKATDEFGETHEHCVRTVHGIQNAIAHAARFGAALDGATLYTKLEPCRSCAMLIVASGIRRVVSRKRYGAGRMARELLEKSGILTLLIEDESEDSSVTKVQ